MARTPEEVEALFQNQQVAGHVGPQLDGLDEDGFNTEEERIWRVLKLKEVLITVQQAWADGDDVLDLITEKLGDGSRDVSWRIPLGESGLLEFFLSILPTEGLRQPLKTHALRLIGNSCADTDENRARVVESNSLSVIIGHLADDSILAFVIPVLYNICVDYEPAQAQACNSLLSSLLVDIISGPRLLQCQNFLNIVCKILALLVTQDAELKVAKPSTPALLLSLATSRTYPPDLEDFCGLTSVALAYLMNEAFQTQLVNTRCFELLQQAFYNSYTQFDLASAGPEEAAALKQVWNAFVQVFADISAVSSFNQVYPLGSPAVQRLITWLSSPASFTHLQTAACLSLGNLSRSDQASTALLQAVYNPLLSILINALPSLSPPSPTLTRQAQPQTVAPPTQLLHAVLSFLKNLAIPAVNKPLLGPALLSAPQSVLPKIWSALDAQPDTQFTAVSLTRLLISNTPSNAARLCAPLSSDPSSPARERSSLHKLFDLAERADAEPTKIEAGRAVASLCRLLHSGPVDAVLPEGTWDDPLSANDGGSDGLTPSSSSAAGSASSPASGQSPSATTGLNPSSDDSPGMSRDPPEDEGEEYENNTPEEDLDLDPPTKRRARFYHAHRDLSRPLRHILMQQKFPTVRGEVLFVLALMSRSVDGMKVVMRVLQGPEPMRALMEGITGRDLIDGHELGEEAGKDGAITATTASGSSSTLTPEMSEMVQGLGLQPQQTDATRTAGMKKIDRENALVLVSEILKRERPRLPLFKKYSFEEMMRKGGELVLQERAQ